MLFVIIYNEAFPSHIFGVASLSTIATYKPLDHVALSHYFHGLVFPTLI